MSEHDADGRGAGADGDRDADALAAWRAMRALVLDNDRRREVSETLGLSFTRVKALRAVAELPQPLTLRALAAQLQTDPPYATRIVDDLEQLGLVARASDPRDRRSKTVAATAAGSALAARAEALLERPPAALAALDAARAAQLARLLETLAD
ncbi:MarR family transcriptional regulator [Conexibacter sp. JD483]|uniref:MarR family transcriptional regulator n=1 Tax=unclassified Conexibacter TaxID=2627773 RepID=UPI002723C76F|nr:MULTISPECIES: MarR family transcriptional regulator [unclassified Conexibacter]MDO8184138.1 MarR family transcriptional regulator [Conexibacter sp. CPCC 205706]MDO8197130.1 MarR family transcriptional regulator [Conexibacter sp. CPCC 205762]MDR9367555.1 MarR family transcriptional regulator [Conexibacter sp. JD483]